MRLRMNWDLEHAVFLFRAGLSASTLPAAGSQIDNLINQKLKCITIRQKIDLVAAREQ